MSLLSIEREVEREFHVLPAIAFSPLEEQHLKQMYTPQ
jgi:hypothetical protein